MALPGSPERPAQSVREQNESGDRADDHPKIKIALPEDVEGD
jgi:hypothetical protein